MLVSLDVSDPANITERNRVYFMGDYVSSRMVNGDILLTYNYQIVKNAIDFDDPATYVPQYGTPENMTCIPGENIFCPENANATRYTVVCKVDGDTLAVEGSTALLSYSQELYVSEDTIYATHSYTERNQEKFDNNYRQETMTEITGISYTGETLEILDTIALEGRVKDQYSMDQLFCGNHLWGICFQYNKRCGPKCKPVLHRSCQLGDRSGGHCLCTGGRGCPVRAIRRLQCLCLHSGSDHNDRPGLLL